MRDWPTEAFDLLLALTQDHKTLSMPLAFDKSEHDAADWIGPLVDFTLYKLGGKQALAERLITRLGGLQDGALLPPFPVFSEGVQRACIAVGMYERQQQMLFEAMLVIRLADKLDGLPDLVKVARDQAWVIVSSRFVPIEDVEGTIHKALDLLQEGLRGEDPQQWIVAANKFLYDISPYLDADAQSMHATSVTTSGPVASAILQLLPPDERPMQIQAAAARLALEYGNYESLDIIVRIASPSGHGKASSMLSLLKSEQTESAALSLLQRAFDAYRSQAMQFPQTLPDALAFATPSLLQLSTSQQDAWMYNGDIFEWLVDVFDRNANEQLSWSAANPRVQTTPLEEVAELASTSPYLTGEERKESIYGRSKIARHIEFWSFPPAVDREHIIARAARLLEESPQIDPDDGIIEIPVQMQEDFHRDGRAFCPQGWVDVKLVVPSNIYTQLPLDEGEKPVSYIYEGEYQATRYRVAGVEKAGRVVDILGFIPRQETSAIKHPSPTAFYFPLQAASCRQPGSVWEPQGPSSITLEEIRAYANDPCAHPSINWVSISNEDVGAPLGVQACCRDCGRTYLSTIPIWQLAEQPTQLKRWFSPLVQEQLPQLGLIACNMQRCLQGLDPYESWEQLLEHEPQIDPDMAMQQIAPSLGYQPPPEPTPEDDLEWESFSL